jgi:hypothetical protein
MYIVVARPVGASRGNSGTLRREGQEVHCGYSEVPVC